MKSRTCWLTLVLAGAMAVPVSAQFTESAGTHPVGRWRVDADLLNLGRKDLEGGARAEYLAAGYFQGTWGWTERADLQIAVQSFYEEEFQAPGLKTRFELDPHLYLRGKYWMAGSGEGGPAVALLPFVVLPTGNDPSGHRFVDVGLILPVSASVGERGWIDAQLQFDGRKAAGSRREWTWLASANFQYAATERWTLYLEGVVDVGSGSWNDAAALVGVGAVWALSERAGWDVAVYTGLTDEALDWDVAVRVYWNL